MDRAKALFFDNQQDRYEIRRIWPSVGRSGEEMVEKNRQKGQQAQHIQFRAIISAAAFSRGQSHDQPSLASRHDGRAELAAARRAGAEMRLRLLRAILAYTPFM